MEDLARREYHSLEQRPELGKILERQGCGQAIARRGLLSRVAGG